MQIVSLKLFPCKSYNEVYRRSYSTSVTQDGINKLDEATQGGKVFSPSAISSIATEFIAPSAATSGEVAIENGWVTERYRFVMEVIDEHGMSGASRSIYVGHTDHLQEAVSHNGHIDPNLKFKVNSVYTTKTQGVLRNGVPSNRTLNVGNSQVIYGGNDFAQVAKTGIIDMYSMRPINVFRNQTVLDIYDRYNVPEVATVDTTGSLVGSAALNNRRNNNPATYLYDTLNAYRNGAHAVRETSGDMSTLSDESSYHVKEQEILHDHFFEEMHKQAMRNIRTNGEFTWNALMILCPYIDDITQVFDNTQMSFIANKTGMGQTHWDKGNTYPWGGADNETVAAALVCTVVPSIMLDNLIGDLRVSFTNETADGQIGIQIENGHPIAQGLDTTTLFQRVIDRIKAEVLTKVSCNGQFGFNLLVDSNVYGDTMCTLQLNGGEMRTYVMPTFADNQASPVLTTDKRHFSKVVNDVYSIGSTLFDGQMVELGASSLDLGGHTKYIQPGYNNFPDYGTLNNLQQAPQFVDQYGSAMQTQPQQPTQSTQEQSKIKFW